MRLTPRLNLLALVACSASSHSRATTPPAAPLATPPAVVVRAEAGVPTGCAELGMVAATDGAMALSDACSCAKPELAAGTEAGAVSLAASEASRLGANAVWVIRVRRAHAFRTHSEACCSVVGFRAYGVAFRCGADDLARLKALEARTSK